MTATSSGELPSALPPELRTAQQIDSEDAVHEEGVRPHCVLLPHPLDGFEITGPVRATPRGPQGPLGAQQSLPSLGVCRPGLSLLHKAGIGEPLGA